MVSTERFNLYIFKNYHRSYYSFMLTTPLYYIIVWPPLKFKKRVFATPHHVHYYSESSLTFYTKLIKINYYWLTLSLLGFISVSFAGKGYRLNITSPSRGTTTFNFGHSHLYYVYFHQILPRKETKTRLIFFGLNNFILRESTSALLAAKPINIFTWRGLRYRRDSLRKKVGKVSLYF